MNCVIVISFILRCSVGGCLHSGVGIGDSGCDTCDDSSAAFFLAAKLMRSIHAPSLSSIRAIKLWNEIYWHFAQFFPPNVSYSAKPMPSLDTDVSKRNVYGFCQPFAKLVLWTDFSSALLSSLRLQQCTLIVYCCWYHFVALQFATRHPFVRWFIRYLLYLICMIRPLMNRYNIIYTFASLFGLYGSTLSLHTMPHHCNKPALHHIDFLCCEL